MRVCHGLKDHAVRVVYTFLGFGPSDDAHLIVGTYNIWKVIVTKSHKNYGRDIEDITRWREDMNFMFERQEQYLTSERSERVRYCSCHENIKFISSSQRVMFFLLYGD